MRRIQPRRNKNMDSASSAATSKKLLADDAHPKQAAHLLQANETKLSVGIEVAGLALAEVDYPQGIIHLTSAAARMFGLGQSACTVPRASVHATFHPDDRDELVAKIAAALDPAGEGWFAMEHRIVLPGGEVRWLRVRKQVLFEDLGSTRRPATAILAALDVTQEKSTEVALRHANEALQLFAYGASHDLRAPLRQISAHNSLLLKRFGERLDPEINLLLQRNIQSVRHMDGLISDLLAFAEAALLGEDRPTPPPVDASAVFRAVLDTLDSVVKETCASITSDPLPAVSVQSAHLEQIFQNLLGNALKYRQETEPPRVHVSAARAGNYGHFSIRDNGIGIPAEHQTQVFELFKRLHANQGRFAGSGVGLAICRKLVERYGGRIWLESQTGHGTTAHFTLPVPPL